MKLLLSILIFICLSSMALANPVLIETNSFKFELPSTWKIEELSSQAKIIGPNNEYLIISSYAIDGDGSESDLQALRQSFHQNIRSTIESSVTQSDLKLVSPIEESMSKNGFVVISAKTETLNGKEFFNMFGVVGPKVALLFSVEGLSKNIESSEIVINSIHEIAWL